MHSYKYDGVRCRLNEVGGILITIDAMTRMMESHGSYEAITGDNISSGVWNGHCEDIMRFLRDAPLVVGAAIIHLISREGKISFTRIIPHVGDEYTETIRRLRGYIRHAILIEGRVEEELQKAQELREKAEATGLVDEVEGKPA